MKRNIFQETLFGPRGHLPMSASQFADAPSDVHVRRIGKPFTGGVAVNGLSCLLILAALVACSGSSGDSSTQTPALSFAADCQGTTGVPSTLPPTFATSFLCDANPHIPPTVDPNGYNTFTPSLLVGFPAVGGTYTDPIFGGSHPSADRHGGQAQPRRHLWSPLGQRQWIPCLLAAARLGRTQLQDHQHNHGS